jgi:hypothetical protein
MILSARVAKIKVSGTVLGTGAVANTMITLVSPP